MGLPTFKGSSQELKRAKRVQRFKHLHHKRLSIRKIARLCSK